MEVNKVKLNRVNLNRVCLNTVGACSINKGGSKPPEEDITDALLMEDGVLFLMEDGTYFMFEKAAQPQSKETPKINKSYWNF